METEMKHKGMIGVFDSGVGGISVLKALVKQLPREKFWYYGDSAHAPYGEKTTAQVQQLSMNIADHMVADGVKAIVIACNTATSAAVKPIREKYGNLIPIIGIEPALKPAARALHHGRILVMATPVTLKLEKYNALSTSLSDEAEFFSVACEGLAARIEKGNLEEADVQELLQDLIGDYAGQVDAVVLGCTHYPFVKRQIRAVLGDIPMFDGGEGTARELEKQLRQRGLLNDVENTVKNSSEKFKGNTSAGSLEDSNEKNPDISSVKFTSSCQTQEELLLYRDFFESKI